jgi:hypothetical protein
MYSWKTLLEGETMDFWKVNKVYDEMGFAWDFGKVSFL